MANNRITKSLKTHNPAQTKPVEFASSESRILEAPMEANNQTTEDLKPVHLAQPKPDEPTSSENNIFEVIEKQMVGPIFVVWGPIKRMLFQAALDFAKENQAIDRLNLILESGGGDPDNAFNTIITLRSCCKNLIVHVPSWAKSAATLLCLGADEIVIYPGSELGPLDMQVQDPRNSTETISALSGYRALEAVANFLHNELDVTVKQLLQRAGTNITESLSYAMQLVTPMARPLFEQVNPIDLGNFSNALDVSEKYGKELLMRFGTPEKQAETIARQLVRGYPSHSFVIDIQEAKKIGLKVREASADEIMAMGSPYHILETNLTNNQYYGPFRILKEQYESSQ